MEADRFILTKQNSNTQSLFLKEELHCRTNPNNNKSFEINIEFRSFFSKSMISSIFLISLLILANYRIKLTPDLTNCMRDNVQELVKPITNYLEKNTSNRNTLIIFSSLIIDLIVLITCFNWVIYGKSWKFIISIVCFYIFRAIIQNIYQMPFPEKFLFVDPGFSSLTVSYLKTNDFFFSGHVGIPLLCAHEFKVFNWHVAMWFCIMASLLEGFVMVTSGGHYSVDIFAGWLFALYFIKISVIIAGYTDRFLFSDDEIRKN